MVKVLYLEYRNEFLSHKKGKVIDLKFVPEKEKLSYFICLISNIILEKTVYVEMFSEKTFKDKFWGTLKFRS